MSVPYDVRPAVVTVPAAGKVIELGVPSRGYVHRVAVKQLSGNLDGFEFRVFKKDTIYNADGSQGTEFAQAELFEIGAKVTVTSTNAVGILLEASGHAYMCLTGDKQSDNQRKLYLYIKPAGAGDAKTFGYSTTITHP